MDKLLTLEQAARLIHGVTKETLLRRARQGLLKVSRPGRCYVTTEADLMAMVEACRVRTAGEPPTPQRSIEAATAALDAALEALRKDNPKTALAEWKSKRDSNR